MALQTVQSPIETDERLAGESIGDYTDRLARLGGERGVLRQCSIGWHYECSDPRGERCRCACHPERERTRALPLPNNAGYYVDRQGDAWRLDSDGRWWFGADDENDQRDYAPFIRLYALTGDQLQTVLDALSTAAWVNQLKPDEKRRYEAEWKRIQEEDA